MRTFNISFVIIIGLIFSLCSCSNNIKQKIGILSHGPNEYEVTKNRPLEIPPHFDLDEIKNIKKTDKAHQSLTDDSLNNAQKDLLEEIINK